MGDIKIIARPAIILAMVYILSGCPQSTSVIGKEENIDFHGNPAVKKCVDNGYEILSINTNGVPSGNWCINAKTKIKCEAWSFYRGDCLL